MICHAKGLLRHHFWGTYLCSIALRFATEAHAAIVLRAGALDGDWSEWKQGADQPRVLVWHGAGGEFGLLKLRLVELGADGDKIDSLAKSIDFGEPFEVTITVTDPNQLTLAFDAKE